MIAAMRRFFLWLLLLGGVGVVLVLWQAFTIAAYVRGAGEGAIDAHLTGSFLVHVTRGAVGFLVLCVAQLAFLGDTDEQGGWINGLHGFLALVILLCGVAYAARARRELGLRAPAVSG